MTTNYLQMMIDSLNKKKDILTRIIALNEEQDKILSKPELDDNAFDALCEGLLIPESSLVLLTENRKSCFFHNFQKIARIQI